MAGAVYTAVNHKKIRCKCCGKNLDMSVDVDSTEPQDKPVEVIEDKTDEEAPVRVPARRSSIHDDDKEVEKKHYRKSKIAPIPEEV